MQRTTVVSFLIAVVGFGIVVPWWKGFEFLDPTVFLASTAVSLVFVAPMTAASFSKQHAGGQISRAAGFAWMMALLIVVSGIVTVNSRNWLGQLLMPSLGLLVASLVFNGVSAVFLAVVTMEAALRTGNQSAGIQYVRIGFFAILLGLVFLERFAAPSTRSWFDEMITRQSLPRILLAVSGILVVLSAILWRRVRRLSAD